MLHSDRKLSSVVYLTEVWKSEFIRDEIFSWGEYLAEEMSKQSVKGSSWFLLAAYSKIQEQRDWKTSMKKKTGLDNLRNSRLIQIAKDIKIIRFTVKRACLGEKSQEYGWTTFC